MLFWKLKSFKVHSYIIHIFIQSLAELSWMNFAINKYPEYFTNRQNI